MKTFGWYMIVYDIADPKRLRKVHKILKDKGLPVQKSVFFYRGTEKIVNPLLDKISTVMSLKEDDLRAYPVSHPRNVWTTGGVLETAPLIDISQNVSHQLKTKPDKPKHPKKKPSWLKRITLLFSKKEEKNE